MDGFSISCKLCHKTFYICKSCYRGHKYCSYRCRRKGYLIKQKVAQAKYQKTFKGRFKHALRQKKYRLKVLHQKVTHKTYSESKIEVNTVSTKTDQCMICKKYIFRTFKSFEKYQFFRSYYEKT